MPGAIKEENENGGKPSYLDLSDTESELTDLDDEDPNDMIYHQPQQALKGAESTENIKSDCSPSPSPCTRDGHEVKLEAEPESNGIRGQILKRKCSLTEFALDIKEESQDVILLDRAPVASRPAKRARLYFAGVIVPTLAQLITRWKEEAKEDYKKLAMLKNPKVKKNEDDALLPETVRYRLKPIGLDIENQYFTIDQPTREVTITRRFLSNVYGGNMQHTFPKPKKELLDIHGMDDFMCCNTQFQPHAPVISGAPGLFMNPYVNGNHWQGIYRVITKIEDKTAKNNDRWQYVGQYKIEAADPPYLTVKEWKAQLPKCRRKWGRGIVGNSWGVNVRIRIFARRTMGREPTREEFEEIEASGKYKSIDNEDVDAAFLSGKERMGVWTLKCIDYDNNFQLQLSQKFPTWIPPPPRANRGKGSVHDTAVGAVEVKLSGSQGQKRKRAETPESEDESDTDLVDVIDISDD